LARKLLQVDGKDTGLGFMYELSTISHNFIYE